jgi:hypothetical protein
VLYLEAMLFLRPYAVGTETALTSSARCGKKLNADLNAGRNFALAGKSGKGRLPVNQPNASRDDSPMYLQDSGSDERECEFHSIAVSRNS